MATVTFTLPDANAFPCASRTCTVSEGLSIRPTNVRAGCWLKINFEATGTTGGGGDGGVTSLVPPPQPTAATKNAAHEVRVVAAVARRHRVHQVSDFQVG